MRCFVTIDCPSTGLTDMVSISYAHVYICIMWQLSSPTDVAVNHEAITFVSDSVALMTHLKAHALAPYPFLSATLLFPTIRYHTPAHSNQQTLTSALIFPTSYFAGKQQSSWIRLVIPVCQRIWITIAQPLLLILFSFEFSPSCCVAHFELTHTVP